MLSCAKTSSFNSYKIESGIDGNKCETHRKVEKSANAVKIIYKCDNTRENISHGDYKKSGSDVFIR